MKNWTKNLLLTPFNLMYKMNPKKEIELLYRLKTGQKLNLKNPVTFNEKLNWIKIYDKNPLMPICSDKYTVREYIESCGLSEILNDLYWEGFDPNSIPFDDLPEKFVIKVSHGSGLNIFCEDKSKLDFKKTVGILSKWLGKKYLPCYGEWFYGVVRPRIIIEKLLLNENNSPPYDYKVFCFNGTPKFIEVHTGRFQNHKRTLYDLDWNVMRNKSIGNKSDHTVLVERPQSLEKLLQYAKEISCKFNHARVDFFILNEKIYFSEITFMNGAGFSKISPHEFDIEMGSWLSLSNMFE